MNLRLFYAGTILWCLALLSHALCAGDEIQQNPQTGPRMNLGTPTIINTSLDEWAKNNPDKTYIISVATALGQRWAFDRSVDDPTRLGMSLIYAASNFRHGNRYNASLRTNLSLIESLMLSEELNSMIINHFYEEKRVLRKNARGFSAQHMGDLLVEMANRNMFIGLSPVTSQKLENEDQRQRLIADAVAKGNKGFESYIRNAPIGEPVYGFEKGTMSRIADMMEPQLEMLQRARRVCGNRPVAELMTLVEKTTGFSVDSQKGLDQAMRNLTEIDTQARSLNLPPQDYLLLQQTTMTAVTRQGSESSGYSEEIVRASLAPFMTEAMRIGEAAFQSNQQMRQYDPRIPSVSRERAIHDAAFGAWRANQFDFQAVTALSASEFNGSAEQKQRVRDTVKRLGDTSGNQRNDILGALNAMVVKLTGSDAGAYRAASGGADTLNATLSQENQDLLSNVMNAQARALLQEHLGDLATGLGTSEKMGMTGDAAAGRMLQFFGTLDARTQEDVIGIMEKRGANVQADIAKRLQSNRYDQEKLGVSVDQYATQLAADNANVMRLTHGADTLGNLIRAFRIAGLGGNGMNGNTQVYANKPQIESVAKAAKMAADLDRR